MGTEGGARGAVWRAGSLAVGFIGGACAMLGLGGPSSSVQPVYRPTRDVHAQYIKYASGTDSITAYLAYPERADPAPAVLVIHEISASPISYVARPRISRRTGSSPSRRTC